MHKGDLSFNDEEISCFKNDIILPFPEKLWISTNDPSPSFSLSGYSSVLTQRGWSKRGFIHVADPLRQVRNW